MHRFLLLTLATFAACTVQGQPPEPVLAVPDKLVLQADFNQPMQLPKSIWATRQGTRWTVENGVLRGRQSSQEFQASREHHFGYEPRLSIPVTPADFIATFRIRFTGGSITSVTPFIEFDHHVCRVRFGKDSTTLLADHEIWKVAEAQDFVLSRDHWYAITAERKGTEFVMQITDGPLLYADHSEFGKTPQTGSRGMGVAGPKKGEVEIDDLKIWAVQKHVNPRWSTTRARIPDFTPVQLKTRKPSKTSRTRGRDGKGPAKAGESSQPKSRQ